MEEIFGSLIVVFAIFFFLRMFIVANLKIRKWAKENDFKILKNKFRLIRTGPFSIAYNQPVYKLLVRKSDGETETCWIRCGSYGGFDPKPMEVRWVKQKEP